MGESFKLCMGCMNPMSENGVCDTCGYIDGTPYLPSYLAPKTILNERYIVGKLKSYNGESATYMAYDKVTNEKVFVREFMPDTLCSRVRGSSLISVNPSKLVQYKNFMSEFTDLNKILTKMRTLSHINPALDLFAQNNTTYVVLEYIDGITLKHYLQDNAGELTWQQVKKLFPPIFTTLSLIHNAGIVHRGISLDTIYFTKKGELKLTGFSIPASRTANTELAPELFGGFAAPEQYSSNNWQGTWTDVYAISSVLYRVLTGCMPTEAVSRIGNDSLLEPHSITPNVPANVSKVIMSGLKLNGELRVQTITELVTKLFEQPDYMEQSRTNTSTVIIPRQTLTQSPKDTQTDKKTSFKYKLPFIVGGVTLLVLLLFSLLLMALLKPNDDTKKASTTSKDDTSLVDSSFLDSELDSSLDSEESSTIDSKVDSQPNAPLMSMPNLVGGSFDQLTKSESITAWMTLVQKASEYSDSVKKGDIISQDIPEGKDITAGTTVNVTVSNGAQFAKVPDYFGKTEKDYLKELADLNIKYDTAKFETSEIMAGYVAKISKSVDDSIDLSNNETLLVYIATTPAPTT